MNNANDRLDGASMLAGAAIGFVSAIGVGGIASLVGIPPLVGLVLLVTCVVLAILAYVVMAICADNDWLLPILVSGPIVAFILGGAAGMKVLELYPEANDLYGQAYVVFCWLVGGGLWYALIKVRE